MFAVKINESASWDHETAARLQKAPYLRPLKRDVGPHGNSARQVYIHKETQAVHGP